VAKIERKGAGGAKILIIGPSNAIEDWEKDHKKVTVETTFERGMIQRVAGKKHWGVSYRQQAGGKSARAPWESR